jgi:hypothetical protein
MVLERGTQPLAMQLAIAPEIDLEGLSKDTDAARRNYDARLQHRSDLDAITGLICGFSICPTSGSTQIGKDDDQRTDD